MLIYLHSLHKTDPVLYYDILNSLCSFFFNDTATTEIYTLSLHDALPIWIGDLRGLIQKLDYIQDLGVTALWLLPFRSEEHTSELQSQSNLVCRLLLEKKKVTPPTGRRSNLSDRLPAGMNQAACRVYRLPE